MDGAGQQFEGRAMLAGMNAFEACGHQHATMKEARACARNLWPWSGTTHARTISHQPAHLRRFVLSARARKSALAQAKRYLANGGRQQ